MSLIAAILFYCGGVVLFVSTGFTLLRLDRRRSLKARMVRAALMEVMWAALLQLALPLGFLLWPSWWRRPRAPGEIPVLFVHGYGQNRADFYMMAHRFRSRGRGSLYGINYRFFDRIARSAERLAEAVESVCQRTGSPKVHLVCHSLGGVVSRHYIELLGGADRVASLTALASPFAGTHRAFLCIGGSSEDLHPQSAYMRQRQIVPAQGVIYRSVWSHADYMVVPPHSASLGEAGEDLVLEDQGHLTVLASRVTCDAVAAWVCGNEGTNEPSKLLSLP